MSVVPANRVDKIEFYENHVGPWAANAVAIGTTAGDVTNVQAKTEAARTAYEEHQAAQTAAKAKTLAFYNAVEAMADAGSDVIKQIRAKAATAGDNVYVLAQIPAPATPSPVGAPGTPSGFKVELFQDGSLGLTWKCANPAGSNGTMYQVFRRVGAAGEFTYLGGSGEKKFTDATVPAGASQVTYQVQAVRSTAVGQWAQFNVNFGTTSAGAATATVGEATPKIAA